MNAEDTSNAFEVVKHFEQIRILKPPTRPLTKSEAIRLAAWLVAMADPERKQFDRILDYVLKT